jgi:membrane protease YdiL (CAAX protease family)
MPWSETAVLLGVWLAVAAFIGPRLLIGPAAEALGGEPEFTDIGNAFEELGEVAAYADVALSHAASGNAIPAPPRIEGNAVAARVAWSFAIGTTVLFAGIAVASSGRGFASFRRHTGLGRLDFDRLWIPGLAVAMVYLAVGGYVRLVDALELEALQTEPGGLEVTLRDGWALGLYAITTIVAAPVGEELFYRGLVFGGLGHWGFFPAALVSSALFALSHVDAATVVPFLAVGMTLSWLYWRSGSLWDAIAFHVIFNLLSFILLLART